jgi:hypothetical protein
MISLNYYVNKINNLKNLQLKLFFNYCNKLIIYLLNFNQVFNFIEFFYILKKYI